MKLGTTGAAAMLSALNTLYNGGSLTCYSGTEPTTPETALSGNTALAVFTFSATAFATPGLLSGYEQAQAAFANATVSPSASGTVTFARATESGGTVLADYTIGTSGTDITIGSTTITVGTQVTLSSFANELPAY